MLQHVPAYPGDPILSLMEAFQVDPNPSKANLGIGLYYDDDGRIPVLRSVAEAARILRQQAEPYTYLPMEGRPALRRALQRLVFGADSVAVAQDRVATIQTVGGSGAVHLAARFIRAHMPGSAIWISDPTWDNHRTLLESAGVEVHAYPYFDAFRQGVDAEKMLAALDRLPAGSVVLLQPSCHNPTGCDLTAQQWDDVIEVICRRGLVPFADMAYQGFGDGLDADAAPIRKMVAAGLTLFVANSFSKNFSLYGERIGGLSVVCQDADTAARVLGQLKALVRTVYSSPPAHGARLVETVLTDPGLTGLWESELDQMRERIKRMRRVLAEVLEARAPQVDASYLTRQRGMFSYTGLDADEAQWLKDERSVYLVRTGRICVAGLNRDNAGRVAEAFAEVFARRTAAARN